MIKQLMLLVVVMSSMTWRSQAQANLTSDVRPYKGVPALYVDGKMTSQILAAPYQPGPSDFTDFANAGISTFDIYLRFPWTGPEAYDFRPVDEKLDRFLSIKPTALFLPRVLLTPGAWWCKTYPNEITMRDDGSPAGMFGQPCHPSMASDVYRQLSHKAMIAFINHVESKYGSHILGYQVGNGFGGEWLPFNSFWEARPGGKPPTKFGVEDYSPPAKAAFRAWLRQRYHNQLAELRNAWKDNAVTYETAEPPNEKERYTSTHGIFFDPAVSRRVPDYFSFFNDMVGNTLLENAAWVKELTQRKKIVGAFYGYLWINFPNLSNVHSGGLALDRVLRSKDVDFIASPYSYDNKQIGGPNYSQTLPAAVQLHGKLYFNEVDTETYLKQRQWRWGNSLIDPTNWEETKALLTRDYAYAATNGFGMWWTDLHGGNFHDPQIIDLLHKFQDLSNSTLTADRRSNADIAVVLDTTSFTYTGDGDPLFNAVLTAQRQWQLAYLGASWDPQLLSDMGNPKLRDYKLYIFLNTFHVTPEQRAAIHARLRRNGATAIWVYAPGYINDSSLSAKDMQELTGIHLAEDDTSGELTVGITSFNHPYTKGLPPDFKYGTSVDVQKIIRTYDHQIYLKDPRDPSLQRDLPGFRINPRFWSDDPKAHVLGTLDGINKPGLVVKKVANWTSIYSSAPILPTELLRNIVRAAGCHIYDEGNDVIYANKNMLSVYSPTGGSRTLHLPGRSNVVDLLEKKKIAEGVESFSLDFKPNTTVLLGIERAATESGSSHAAHIK